jgi:hypothetical protein
MGEDCCGDDGIGTVMSAYNQDFQRDLKALPAKALSLTDLNDATVIATTFTRGSNAVNIDGSQATGLDKTFALGGVLIPFVSGSAIRRAGSEAIEFIGERAVGAYKNLQGKFYQAHHAIQDKAVSEVEQIAGFEKYSKREATTVHLEGHAKKAGTEHNAATKVQGERRALGDGGTYGAERRVGYRALRASGISRDNSKEIIRRADDYFMKRLGFKLDTPTKIPKR